MKPRLLALPLLGTLTACSLLLEFPGTEGRPCDNGRCNAGYRCEQNVCVQAPPDLCDPACADWEQCDQNVCRPRYAGIDITSPRQGDVVNGAPRLLSAQLQLNVGRTRNDPPALPYVVSPTAGGAPVSGTLRLQGDAGYQGSWSPTAEGSYQVQVLYPDAGLSGAVTVTADMTPPAFALSVPSPVRVGDGGTFNDRDPSMPQAWRRDEVVRVQASSMATDVDPASVMLDVAGVGDAGTQDLVVPMVQNPFCDAGFCATYDLPLWTPRMKSFRGNFVVKVTGADKAGNAGTAASVVPVTRWKWSLDTGVQLGTSPAIGAKGTVYVGGNTTSPTVTGWVLALSPEGALRWMSSAPGPLSVSPMVGAATGNTEPIYVAASGPNGSLAGLSSADGGVVALCNYNGDIQGALALGETDSGTDLAYAVMTFSDGGRSVVALPANGFFNCYNLPVSDPIALGGGMVASGKDLFYTDDGGRVQSFSFDGGLAARTYWPADLPGKYGLTARTLAVAGTSLVAGSSGTSSGSFVTLDPVFASNLGSVSTVTTAYPAAVNAFRETVAGYADNVLRITPLPGASGTAVSWRTDGGVVSGPALGQGGFIYAATTDNVLHVWRGNLLAHEWDLSDVKFSATGSVALDCSRNAAGTPIAGRPGVLYVPSTTGALLSFVVDSQGIDTTALWPKYQHDPRNTANASTPLSAFACP